MSNDNDETTTSHSHEENAEGKDGAILKKARLDGEQNVPERIALGVPTEAGGASSTIYEKMESPIVPLKSHVFHTLQRPGLIERYDVYRSIESSSSSKNSSTSGGSSSSSTNSSSSSSSVGNGRELVMANIQLGTNLNGHDGIVHGGIISLLFDETFGWGTYYHLAQSLHKNYTDTDLPVAVTANLSVNFRAPLPAERIVVIRIYYERTEGRKIYLNGRMESSDGSVLYSNSNALFITMKQTT